MVALANLQNCPVLSFQKVNIYLEWKLFIAGIIALYNKNLFSSSLLRWSKVNDVWREHPFMFGLYGYPLFRNIIVSEIWYGILLFRALGSAVFLLLLLPTSNGLLASIMADGIVLYRHSDFSEHSCRSSLLIGPACRGVAYLGTIYTGWGLRQELTLYIGELNRRYIGVWSEGVGRRWWAELGFG